MDRPYPYVLSGSRFLESHFVPYIPQLSNIEGSGDYQETHNRSNINLSSRLPSSVWYILAKCLGIKLNPSDKPTVATIFHMLTLLAALSFAIPGALYTVYDIRSQFSKTTVLIGTVQLAIGFSWACMGVYAHKLAGHLLGNKNFAECVRVHSKTFLKIRISWLALILGLVLVIVNCYERASMFSDSTCKDIQLHTFVCQIYFVGRCAYAALTLAWNFIVAYVLFSVCRTHTISKNGKF